MQRGSQERTEQIYEAHPVSLQDHLESPGLRPRVVRGPQLVAKETRPDTRQDMRAWHPGYSGQPMGAQ